MYLKSQFSDYIIEIKILSQFKNGCDIISTMQASFSTRSYIDIISYPLFVHAIRENINGLGSYHTRLKAECDTNPNH